MWNWWCMSILHRLHIDLASIPRQSFKYQCHVNYISFACICRSGSIVHRLFINVIPFVSTLIKIVVNVAWTLFNLISCDSFYMQVMKLDWCDLTNAVSLLICMYLIYQFHIDVAKSTSFCCHVYVYCCRMLRLCVPCACSACVLSAPGVPALFCFQTCIDFD